MTTSATHVTTDATACRCLDASELTSSPVSRAPASIPLVTLPPSQVAKRVAPYQLWPGRHQSSARRPVHLPQRAADRRIRTRTRSGGQFEGTAPGRRKSWWRRCIYREGHESGWRAGAFSIGGTGPGASGEAGQDPQPRHRPRPVAVSPVGQRAGSLSPPTVDAQYMGLNSRIAASIARAVSTCGRSTWRPSSRSAGSRSLRRGAAGATGRADQADG
jgi:hypothetical protein